MRKGRGRKLEEEGKGEVAVTEAILERKRERWHNEEDVKNLQHQINHHFVILLSIFFTSLHRFPLSSLHICPIFLISLSPLLSSPSLPTFCFPILPFPFLLLTFLTPFPSFHPHSSAIPLHFPFSFSFLFLSFSLSVFLSFPFLFFAFLHL